MARFILSFCVFALFAAVVLASSVEEEPKIEVDDEVDRGLGNLLKEFVIKQVKKYYKMINIDCVEEAIGHCKHLIKSFSKVSECVINYFQDNKQHCLNEV